MQFPVSMDGRATAADILNSVKLKANEDVFATGENVPFTFTIADLLANDGGIVKSFVGLQTTMLGGGATITYEDGVFTYDPGGRFDYLGAGQTAVDGFKYTIRNGLGHTSTAQVWITITGTNDEVQLNHWTGTAPTQVVELADGDPDEDGFTHTTSGALDYTDTDLYDTHSFSFAPQGEGYLGTFSAVMTELAHPYDRGFVDWTFTVDDAAVAFLGEGETSRQYYDVSVSDAHGGTTTRTVEVDLVGTNDAPTTRALEAVVADDGRVTLTPFVSDADLSDAHTVSVDAQGLVGTAWANPDGSITYDPGRLGALGEGESIVEQFTFTVSDGHGGEATATATVRVEGRNDAPVVQALTAQVGEGAGAVLLSPMFEDPDGDDAHTVRIEAGSLRGKAEMIADGRISYAPAGGFEFLAAGETAAETFVYTVTDSHGATGKNTVTVTVAGENDAPVAQALSGTVRAWGWGSFVSGLDSSTTLTPVFSDADRSDVHRVGVDTRGTIGAAWLQPDNTIRYDENRAFTWLGEGETATDRFTYTVLDNHGGRDTKTVTVTVIGTNDDPDARPIEAAMTAHGGSLTLAPLFKDADLHDTHTVEVANLSGRAKIEVNPNGTISYDPGRGFDWLGFGETTTDSFVYVVEDNHGGIDKELVTVRITGDNHLPVAERVDAAMTIHAGPLTVEPAFTDADASDTHVVTAAAKSSRGIPVVTNPDGTFTYDPHGAFDYLRSGESLVDDFSYEVRDSHGAVSRSYVVVTIASDNHDPVAQPLAATVRADGSVLTLKPAFADPDAGDAHTLSFLDWGGSLALSRNLSALVTLNPDGTFTYDTAGLLHLGPGQSVTDTFSFLVQDNRGGYDIKSATITLTGDALPDTARAVAVAETPGVFLDPTPHEAAGAIVSLPAGATASIGAQTVRFLAPGIREDILRPAQVEGLKGSFHVAADAGGDGAFHWSFSVQDRNIDFLRAGDRAVLVTDVLIDDHHGHVDHALVTVTLLGAAEPPLPQPLPPLPEWWA
ncbi:MAG TPA: Ig-like domain-containing protein [Beijerinckiaceae bacterium]|jgi:VCBS repeat-containing protein